MCKSKSQLAIYSNGELELKVSIDNETIWLRTEDIALLFDVKRPAIVKHIGNIYKSGELEEYSTCSILEQLTKDGKKRKVKYYNLDVIISVGYRVNSIKATKFRQWATTILKNYIYKGYSINTEKITHQRFKELENDVALLKHKIKLLEKNNIKHQQGIYFEGQIFDAYKFINDLLKTANNSIKLIDNYIDESVLTLFSKIPNIKVIIYTKNITKQLKLDFNKYNSQYNNVEIKKFGDSHDRFLIIDNKEIYHIGSSLKDLGKKIFAFSKMEIDTVKLLEKLTD